MSLPHIVYNLVILPLLYPGFRIAGIFNAKVRRGIAGRAGLFQRLQQHSAALPQEGPRILVHAASMGEYEQARPVLRLLRQRLPTCTRILSVFSPSVYDNIQGRAEAEVLTYLPFDSRRNARKFLDLLRPDAVLVTRHDIWPNFLWQAAARGILTVLIDASVHEGSLRHKPVVRQFVRAVFRAFTAVFPISDAAAHDMQAFISKESEARVVGDTRFDQVVYRATEKPLSELLPARVQAWRHVIVAGSTWPEDEHVLVPAFAHVARAKEGLKLILVPHEPTEAHLQQGEKLCARHGLRAVRLSTFNGAEDIDVLLVDRIGILANLYAAGRAAFVGGAFGPGVHSVIEAAAHGVPVLFGPRMRNSAEAIEMLEEGCGFVVDDVETCRDYLAQWFTGEKMLRELSARSRAFVQRRTGASEAIVKYLVCRLAHNEGHAQ